jgi:hypothetical protein
MTANLHILTVITDELRLDQLINVTIVLFVSISLTVKLWINYSYYKHIIFKLVAMVWCADSVVAFVFQYVA